MSDTTYKWRMDDGGWGIPPLAPSFTVTAGDTKAILGWSVPENIEIEDQEVCRAAGIIIRRKTDGYPQNENDGDLVINSTTLEGTYQDTGLTNGTDYYYRAFAYSDHNVVNRNPDASGTARPAVWAATVNITTGSPEFYNKTIVVKKNGTQVGTTSFNGSGQASYTAESVGTYSFTVTYNGQDFTEEVEVTAQTTYSVQLDAYVVFAFHYSENDSDPDSVTYPEGYDNYGWDPFEMNLSTGVPDYGDWDPAGANANKLRWFYPKSCMLKFDGTVDYYLDEDDETKKEDGVTASDVASTAYAGNAMMEWGQDGKMIYWKVVPDQDGKGFTFVVANGKVDNDMEAWNHYDANGDLTPHFYTAKYFGSKDSNNKLRSISGGTNMVSQTRQTEVTYARNNNPDSDVIWDTEVYSDWFLIGMLCCLMGKSMNTQAKFGKGNNNTSAAIGQGTMNGKGMFFGKSDNGTGVKVFGMENFWGNIWRAIRGLVTDGSTKAKVKLTHGTQDGTTASDYNFDGTGYLTKSAISGTSGGYINAMDIDTTGLTPKTVSGSETTYYTDGCWLAANCYALVGGAWSYAGMDGALCVYLDYAASGTGTRVGAALSCKPLAA